jgi:hypothetical protein
MLMPYPITGNALMDNDKKRKVNADRKQREPSSKVSANSKTPVYGAMALHKIKSAR